MSCDDEKSFEDLLAEAEFRAEEESDLEMMKELEGLQDNVDQQIKEMDSSPE